MRSAPSPYSVQQDTGTTLYNRHVQALPNAIDDLSTAVELAPDNPDYPDLLARLLFVWDQPDKAIAEQQKAVQLVEAGRKEEFQARLNLYKQAATR